MCEGGHDTGLFCFDHGSMNSLHALIQQHLLGTVDTPYAFWLVSLSATYLPSAPLGSAVVRN